MWSDMILCRAAVWSPIRGCAAKLRIVVLQAETWTATNGLKRAEPLSSTLVNELTMQTADTLKGSEAFSQAQEHCRMNVY